MLTPSCKRLRIHRELVFQTKKEMMDQTFAIPKSLDKEPRPGTRRHSIIDNYVHAQMVEASMKKALMVYLTLCYLALGPIINA